MPSAEQCSRERGSHGTPSQFRGGRATLLGKVSIGELGSHLSKCGSRPRARLEFLRKVPQAQASDGLTATPTAAAGEGLAGQLCSRPFLPQHPHPGSWGGGAAHTAGARQSEAVGMGTGASNRTRAHRPPSYAAEYFIRGQELAPIFLLKGFSGEKFFITLFGVPCSYAQARSTGRKLHTLASHRTCFLQCIAQGYRVLFPCSPPSALLMERVLTSYILGSQLSSPRF